MDATDARLNPFGSVRFGRARRQCWLCRVGRISNDGARDEAKGDGAQGDESNGGCVLNNMTTTTRMNDANDGRRRRELI